MNEATAEQLEPAGRRVVKRYSNRKLYDTKDSRYVTLLQIAEMVRGGEDVQIIDNATKEDKTDVTLALIISEELKSKPRGIPLTTLKALIRHRGERVLNQIKQTTVGVFIDEDSPAEGAPADAHDQHLEALVEQRIKEILPDVKALEDQVRQLTERVQRLEQKIDGPPAPPQPAPGSPAAFGP